MKIYSIHPFQRFWLQILITDILWKLDKKPFEGPRYAAVLCLWLFVCMTVCACECVRLCVFMCVCVWGGGGLWQLKGYGKS